MMLPAPAAVPPTVVFAAPPETATPIAFGTAPVAAALMPM
jgi:hypothetical protein